MKIRIVQASPGRAPVVTEIENSLEGMQEAVGGLIECVRMDDLDLWVNEEGLVLGLPFNRVIEGLPLVGSIFVAASNEAGDTVGLTDAQVARALALLSVPATEVQA